MAFEKVYLELNGIVGTANEYLVKLSMTTARTSWKCN